jgi:hypothetical protein
MAARAFFIVSAVTAGGEEGFGVLAEGADAVMVVVAVVMMAVMAPASVMSHRISFRT